MANVGDTVILKTGKDAVVTNKFDSTIPHENDPATQPAPLGYWEAANPTCIPQNGVIKNTTPDLTLDAQRNAGKAKVEYFPNANPIEPTKSDKAFDQSTDREFESSGPYDSIPYVEYTVKNVPAPAPDPDHRHPEYQTGNASEQRVLDSDFVGQLGRVPTVAADGTVTYSKLDKPGIP